MVIRMPLHKSLLKKIRFQVPPETFKVLLCS